MNVMNKVVCTFNTCRKSAELQVSALVKLVLQGHTMVQWLSILAN